MKRMSAITLLALSAGFSGAALAADPQQNDPDKSQVVPSREQVDKSNNVPSAGMMDNNVQRQHDRDQAAGSQGSSQDSTSQAGGGASGSGTGAQAAGTRDWSKVDQNGDNFIQPEEMESWLQKEGPQAGATKQ